jgi:hypothetical protein
MKMIIKGELTLALFVAYIGLSHTIDVEKCAQGDRLECLQEELASQLEEFFKYLPEIKMEYAPDFALETDWGAIWAAFNDAIIGSVNFLRHWLVFFQLISVPCLKCLNIIFEALLPHVLAIGRFVVVYFKSMDPNYQAILVASTLFIAVCIRQGYFTKVKLIYIAIRKSIKQKYRNFLAQVREKSRVAALLLPHIGFLTVAYVIMYWMPNYITEVFERNSLFPLLTVILPLTRSIRAIRRRRIELHLKNNVPPSASSAISPKSVKSPASYWKEYEICLQYWVLRSFAVCFLSVISLFIPAFVVPYLIPPVKLSNMFLAWLHAPITRGDLILYDLLSPFVNPYANRLKDVSDQGGNEQSNFLLRSLVTFRVLPEQYGNLLKDLWAQGPALVGLIFLFTPGFVTARGALCLGLGFPAYITMGALSQDRRRNYEWWLLYFTVVVSMEYIASGLEVAFSWLPLFYHIKLVLMMWLQFPYFRGAQKIFDAIFASVFIMPSTTEEKDEEAVTNDKIAELQEEEKKNK